ncbi:MAG: polynucleotide adenylyltransferase PcnB, partial [Rhodocyclaceae bacterium]|nr:polynucleotide adenylyltransferase PcnB [Rhodocyclaceae bacterium]
MIRKLLRRVFKKPARSSRKDQNSPAELAVAVHGIRREQVSSAARRTCDTLQQAGFKAYVVGGAVRDLLI